MITNRIAVRCRSTIFSQITKKVLRLPISKTDKSTALTHISADAEGIINSIEGLPMTLVAPFYVGVGLYVLYTVVGKVVALVVPPVFRKCPGMVRALFNLINVSFPRCICLQYTLHGKRTEVLEWGN